MLFPSTRGQLATGWRNRARLHLEALEDRTCLSGTGPEYPPMGPLQNQPPSIEDFTLSPGPNDQVLLSGRVVDEAPSGLTVIFSGAVSGSTITNADGFFSVVLPGSQGGQIQAETTDGLDESSTPVPGVWENQPPVISGFGASQVIGNDWTFEGYVEDEYPCGLVVRFGGLPSLEGKTAVVDANGWFVLGVTLEEGEGGVATAQTTDWEGLSSNIAEYFIDPR